MTLTGIKEAWVLMDDEDKLDNYIFQYKYIKELKSEHNVTIKNLKQKLKESDDMKSKIEKNNLFLKIKNKWLERELYVE